MSEEILQPGPYLVELKVSHFRFAIGGEHYYGKFSVRTKSIMENGRRVMKGGYGAPKAHQHDGFELKRLITTKAEAEYLSEKDGFDHWHTGSDTVRFQSRDDVINAAGIWFLALFNPAKDILITDTGDAGSSDDADIVLSCPMRLTERLLQASTWSDQMEIYQAGGFLDMPEEADT